MISLEHKSPDYIRRQEREATARIKAWCHLPEFPADIQIAARVGEAGEWFPLFIKRPFPSFFTGKSRYLRTAWGGVLLAERLSVCLVVSSTPEEALENWPKLWVTIKADPTKPDLAACVPEEA